MKVGLVSEAGGERGQVIIVCRESEVEFCTAGITGQLAGLCPVANLGEVEESAQAAPASEGNEWLRESNGSGSLWLSLHIKLQCGYLMYDLWRLLNASFSPSCGRE